MNYGKTHCDQSVHNIFTGLQAGATRHLQEQFFGRLPDLQRNILNINFKLKSHFKTEFFLYLTSSPLFPPQSFIHIIYSTYPNETTRKK